MEYEITCRCTWDLPDGAEVVPYMSPVAPAFKDADGKYHPGLPTLPCPACGKVDPFKISSGWHPG